MSQTEQKKTPGGPEATPSPAASSSAATPDTSATTASAALAAVAADAGGEKKKKKKRKYSRGLKELQNGERDVAKASRRLARAVAEGFTTYYRRDRKSSRKKRDGAIRDAVKNWAKGLGKAAKKGSDVPFDLAKALDTKTVRRNVRSAIRFLAPPFVR
jgi:hypothetical protein